MVNEEFDWIPFYMEFADKLLEYKNNRSELVEKVLRLWDNIDMKRPMLELGNEVVDMDPFTVFALFNKQLAYEKRRSILGYFKGEFGVKADVPSSFNGIPLFDSQKDTFYMFGDSKGEQDIDNLWDVLEVAIKYANIKNKNNRKKFISSYNKVIKQIGIGWNLTIALFWIRPYDFINLDSHNREFLSNSDNFDKELSDRINLLNTPPTATDYLYLSDYSKQLMDNGEYNFHNLPELSNNAYNILIEESEENESESEGIGDSEDS